MCAMRFFRRFVMQTFCDGLPEPDSPLHVAGRASSPTYVVFFEACLFAESALEVPSLDEYLGFPVDADAKNLSALGPLLPAPDVAGRIETHANGTTMTRVGCPTGVFANVAQLKQQALHAPRVYAATKVAPKPSYIFVIVPPGYGSTAVLSLLATSPHVGTLCTSAVPSALSEPRPRRHL